MYAYSTEGEGVESYQRSVRDRANASLHELEDVLTGQSPNASLNTSARAKDQLNAAVHPRSLRWFQGDARPQKYRDAVSQLQQMLRDHEQQQSPFHPGQPYATPPPVVRQTGSLPTPDEAVTLLQSQAAYVQQLEAENRYMKDEFSSIRIRIKDVLDENQRLHEELKKSVMEEIMVADGDVIQMPGDTNMSANDLSPGVTRGNLRQWQIELEKLGALHNAKTDRLESQLQHSREEIQKYEQMVEELRAQVRLQDAIPTREDGYHDMFMSESQRNYSTHVIDRLTKERDDMTEQVAGLKTKLQDMAHREEDAYQQMKKGIELVEQAQFEQTQAMVQKEQLSEELNNVKQRFDGHIQDVQRKIQHERESVRTENKVVNDELNNKIRELTEQLTAAQGQMEKVTRDKVSIINELEAAKLQIKQFDREVSMVTDNFNAESTNAKLHKSRADGEVKRLRSEIDTVRREKDQDRSRLNTEMDDLRRRLTKAERELVNSKEECIHLTMNSQALERELHLAKLARDGVERGRTEDLKTLVKRTQSREEELNSFITDLEDKHGQTTSEMDGMLSKQNKLIGKLKTECRRQAAQIEAIMKKNRQENGKLRRHNEELRQRWQRTVTHLKDLEDQSEQHSRVQEKMKERLKMMDDHAQHQGQQILEMLAKQTSLMRDRQLLARELEFLRRNISKNNEDEMNKFVSSNKLLVDDVLDNIRVEDREKRDTYMTKSVDNLGINDLL